MIHKIKHKIDSRLPKGGFARNATTLMTGNVIAQLILLSTYPIVTRLYTPSQFGTYALFTSIFSVLSTIATMRYELAIMLPDKESDAFSVLKLSTLITLMYGFVILIVVFLFNKQIVLLLNNSEIEIWLYFVPFMIVLIGIYQNVRYWLSRNKDYKNIAIANIIRNFFKPSSQIGLITVPSTSFHGLIVGSIIAQTISTFFMLFKLGKKTLYTLFLFKFDDLVCEARKYKNFPLINAPHALLASLSQNIPVALFSMYFSKVSAGFYSVSMVAVGLPVSLISASIGEVFYQRFNRAYNSEEKLDGLVIKLIKTMLKIAIIPSILLFIIAPYLFSFVFGEKWFESGLYTRILVPNAFMVFVASPLAYVSLTLGYQKKSLIIEIVGVVVRTGSILIGIYFKNIYLSLTLFSLSGVCVLTYNMLWTVKIAKNNFPKRAKEIKI